MTTLIPKFQQTGTGAVNRAINLKLAETVSVKDFGAIGDGVTDDTDAIQAAINSGAKTIHVPSGTYSYSQLLINTTGITLEGEGAYGTGASYLVPTAIAQSSIIVSSTASGAEFRIKNLCISGNATSTAAIQLGTAGFAAPVIDIDNCYIFNFTTGVGINITNSWWINIRGNTNINGCYDGIYIPPAGIVTTLNIIENTKITNSLNRGISNVATVDGNVDQITLNHASIETSAKEAIYSTSPNTTVLVNDGYFEGNNTSTTGNAVIYVTSTNTASFKQARLILRDSQFHLAYGTYALSLGYVLYSLVENTYGFRQWDNPIVTISTTGCTFNLNRGDGSTINLLAKLKLLLGSISAFEIDSATGYVSEYNSLPRYQDGDRIFREAHIKSQQTTAPTVVANANAGNTATAVMATGSTDTQGRIDLTVGGAGIAAGQLLTVTFNRTYTTAPLAVLVSYGSYTVAAPALYAVGTGATTFQVGTCGTPVSGLQYINYVVIGGL